MLNNLILIRQQLSMQGDVIEFTWNNDQLF